MSDQKIKALKAAATLTDDQQAMLSALQRVREAVLSGGVGGIFIIPFDNDSGAQEFEVEGCIETCALYFALHATAHNVLIADDDE